MHQTPSVEFLAAVADRLGLLGQPGSWGVAWGDWSHFVTYTQRVTDFAPSTWAPAAAVAATAAEIVLGTALICLPRSRLIAIAATLLLAIYALTMTIELPIDQALHYSIYLQTAGMLTVVTRTAVSATTSPVTGALSKAGTMLQTPDCP